MSTSSTPAPVTTATRIDGKRDVRGPDGLIVGDLATGSAGVLLAADEGAPYVSGVALAKTFDVCLGRSERDAGARVLVTVVGEASALAIVIALRSAMLFECEGLKAFVRASSRDTAPRANAAGS